MGFFDGILNTVVGGVLGSKGQDDANEANMAMNENQLAFSADQAERNRTFQYGMWGQSADYNRQMASTTYQRAVGDLQAAGLNPMLAYSQGGAPSPQMSPSGGSQANTPSMIPMQNKMAAAAQLASTAAQIDNVKADTDLKKAQTGREQSSAGNLEQQTKHLQSQMNKITYEIRNIIQDTHNKHEQQELIRVQKKVEEARERLLNNQATTEETVQELNKALKDLRESDKAKVMQDIEINKPSAEFAKSDMGEANPIVNQILNILKVLQGYRR